MQHVHAKLFRKGPLMSEFQTIWLILWNRAAQQPGPFEISEAAPEGAKALGISAKDAAKRVSELLKELDRLPENERYFTQEGEAVVPLAEFQAADKSTSNAKKTYPFEI